MTPKEMAKLVVQTLEDRKATDIKVINIEKISALADYFIIASGSNHSQVQAMADHVEEALGRLGAEPKSIEGYRAANWILMDYGDIILHIFDEENLLFYHIERIWRDGTPESLKEEEQQ